MKFTIVGNIFDTSGYSVHTRQLFNALARIADVKLATQLVPNWERMVSDRELDAIKKEDNKDRIRIIITSPVYWGINLGEGRNFCFLVWEGDRIPKCFIDECFNPEIEYIFVPSEHTKKAVLNSIENITEKQEVINKLKVMHHGVNTDLFYPLSKEPRKVFKFLVNKGWRNLEDRGGTQYIIKAYIEEFTDKESTELLVKINPAYGIPDLNKLISQLTNKTKDIPKITIDTSNYKYEDLNKMYNSADVFVAPTRAEAFGIPIIEAMATGIPVITSDFGGQTDFVNETNGWLIKSKLEEVKHEIQYEGIKWGTPDITELRNALRKAVNKPEEVLKKGMKALETAKKFSWNKTAEALVRLI